MGPGSYAYPCGLRIYRFHGTRTFPNASDISLDVGASRFSGVVDTPDEILSTISLRRIGGTVSSVARIVRRIIYNVE